MSKMLVLIVTYNEIENVKTILSRVKVSLPDADILFVDDNSPDGTGKLLEEFASVDFSVHVMHRAGKLGVGSAHLDGIAWAYDNNVDVLITLDADCTHSPEEFSIFIDAVQSAAIVVGSRFLVREGIKQWPFHRRVLTRLGHVLTRMFLRIPYDATGAYRAYNLRLIPREVFALVKSKDYSFFYESLKLIAMTGCPITQVPVVLAPRQGGNSKMRPHDVRRGFTYLVSLGARTLLPIGDLHDQTKKIAQKAALLHQ